MGTLREPETLGWLQLEELEKGRSQARRDWDTREVGRCQALKVRSGDCVASKSRKEANTERQHDIVIKSSTLNWRIYRTEGRASYGQNKREE